MRRVISLWLPRLATDLVRRDRTRRRNKMPRIDAALATVAETGGRAVVVAVDDAAEAAGIAPGMGLADARALAPELAAVADDPGAQARALDALADWCDRYTPAVAPSGADGLFLDVTGCAHLMGGEKALLSDLLRRVRGAGLAACAALADTPGAAWGLARFAATPGDQGVVVPPDAPEAALTPLPVAALRLPPATCEDLGRVGLRRVADLRQLERQGGRAPLAARYGKTPLRQLDLALGRADEPISPRRPLVPYRERQAFAEPIATAEDIARAARRLLARLCVRLACEGRGARRVELRFYGVDGAVSAIAAGTARPSRDSHHLFGLLREKLETVAPGFGIDLAVLAAPQVEALTPAQIELPQAHPAGAIAPDGDPSDLAELVDRLGNRLGADQVWRFGPRESHAPERAAAPVPPLSPPSAARWRLPPRPLRLFPRPEPIDAIAEPDAAPSLFRWRAHLHRVRAAEGPERLTPEWWRDDGDGATRDYWRVEDAAGRRFWLFRSEVRSRKSADGSMAWFIHGEFA